MLATVGVSAQAADWPQQETDFLCGAVHAGRFDRRRGPRHRAEAVRAPASIGGGGKQTGRGGRHRRRLCRQSHAGWLYPVRWDNQHACHQPQPVQEPELRPRQGFRARFAGGHAAQRAAGRSAPEAEIGGRPDRAAEEGPGQAHLRLVRRGHLHAPDGRTVRPDDRRAADAHPLQGHAARDGGRILRQRDLHVRPDDRCLAAAAAGQAASCWR